MKNFDVLVIGGGHAGCEAALAAARLGARTGLMTLSIEKMARMSCNPSVGGLAKSHIVSEIDALGGEIGINSDCTGIQFKTLNTRKGPAVQATRVQCDKEEYPRRMLGVLRSTAGLVLIEDEATDIDPVIPTGFDVRASRAGVISTRTVVVCGGTYLNGRIYIGKTEVSGGRFGEISSDALSLSLQRLGLRLSRLKTGTPPRLRKNSLDYGSMTVQHGETPPPFLSWRLRMPAPFHVEQTGRRALTEELFHVEQAGQPPPAPWPPGVGQVPCFVTHTTHKTHEIIREHLSQSALYGGMIKGTGVRYCPSIEDKIVKFPDRDAHHVFVEPEGRNNDRIYPNGTSNSLPESVQQEMIRSIPGMERAEFIRPGYAIEYDCFDPTGLSHALESKSIPGLFVAGQLNGTTGYEEAAAQGFMAGINAAMSTLGESLFTLSRSEAYIGVLIDDLVLKGVDEPYRMFTSRAESRLSLRQDNAALRLADHAGRLGIVPDSDIAYRRSLISRVREEVCRLDRERMDGVLLSQWLCRSGTSLADLPGGAAHDPFVAYQVETEIRYRGYVEIERNNIRNNTEYDAVEIPHNIDYKTIRSMKTECIEKLTRIRPRTLGQAARIPGVNPTDVALLSIWLKSASARR